MSLNIETATIKDTIPSTLYTLFTNLQKVIRCQQFPFYVTHTPADTNLPGPLTEFSSPTQLSVTLRPHGLQHARPPYPSPTSGVYSNSCPLSRGCHPTISEMIEPMPFYFQPFRGISLS